MTETPVRTSAAKLRCPKCRKSFTLPQESTVGDKVHCPSCKAKIRLGLEALQGEVINGYRVLQRIGRGAMGGVFKAEALRDNGKGPMAIKFIAPELREDQEMLARFTREGELCQQLRHPALVRVHEMGRHQQIPYLRMDLLEGVSLDRVLDKSGAMDWRKAAEVTLQMAEVLAYLQEQGVVHRDIKPENILINGKREATLIDLGFAKRVDDAETFGAEANQLTMTGTALGSPAYMAPEQILDAMSASYATDCYCLGASFYHMVTGNLPYEGKNAMETMQQVLSGGHVEPITLRPQMPPRVNQLINWMMAAKPSQRPAAMREVCAILKRLIVDPTDGSGLPDLPRANKALWWALVLVIVAVTAVLAGIFLY